MKKIQHFTFFLILFSIIAYSQTLTITSPNGGENWTMGAVHTITWTSSGVTENVRLKLYKGGQSFGPITTNTANDGHYAFGVPATLNGYSLTSGSDYIIRIETISENANDQSNASFTITQTNPVTLKLTSPNGGQTLKRGTVAIISWNSSGLSGNVNLFLWKGLSNLGQIAQNQPDSGSFTWHVGEKLVNPPGTSYPNGKNYRVMVKSIANNLISDLSDKNFTITTGPLELAPGKPGNLIVTSPKGGDEWERGKTYPIRWLRIRILKDGRRIPLTRLQLKQSGLKLSTVKIEMLRVHCPNEIWEAGSQPQWQTITPTTLDDDVFHWFIPTNILGCFKIRITENRANGQKAVSKRFRVKKNQNEPTEIPITERKK